MPTHAHVILVLQILSPQKLIHPPDKISGYYVYPIQSASSDEYYEIVDIRILSVLDQDGKPFR